MRTAFIEELTVCARENDRLILLTGDLGYTVFESFQQEFPSRYFNMGVSEANMVGTAAGLAKEGWKPFVYSIVPFATLRCLEQIRDDLCYHRLPVTIVGVGAGYSYGDMGATHHSIEDIAVMRSLPELTVVCPGDPLEVKKATRALAHLPTPAYLRLGKRGEPRVHESEELAQFQLGKALVLQEGGDIALIATSNMLPNAKHASELLQTHHRIPSTLVSMHTLKPFDGEAIQNLAKTKKALFTIEEHSVIGGLGSAVCEVVASLPTPCVVRRIGIPDTFVHVSGSQQYYREQSNLHPEGIVQTIITTLTTL